MMRRRSLLRMAAKETQTPHFRISFEHEKQKVSHVLYKSTGLGDDMYDVSLVARDRSCE